MPLTGRVLFVVVGYLLCTAVGVVLRLLGRPCAFMLVAQPVIVQFAQPFAFEQAARLFVVHSLEKMHLHPTACSHPLLL